MMVCDVVVDTPRGVNTGPYYSETVLGRCCTHGAE